MDIFISERAEKELEHMDHSLAVLFISHIEKIATIPRGRHLSFGIPYNVEKATSAKDESLSRRAHWARVHKVRTYFMDVEKVTKQARIIDHIENKTITVLHCFSTHKDYEKWFRSFK